MAIYFKIDQSLYYRRISPCKQSVSPTDKNTNRNGIVSQWPLYGPRSELFNSENRHLTRSSRFLIPLLFPFPLLKSSRLVNPLAMSV